MRPDTQPVGIFARRQFTDVTSQVILKLGNASPDLSADKFRQGPYLR